ncbi:MAG: molybdopterin-dependent oxidoreductase [Caulobacteraceae bacterium]|nr:molybdopterin-dependent oxidoreductase [Caulobacteraceae bacterium]
MTHEGFKLVVPKRGVHALTEYVTAEPDVFLVTHMGLAAVDPAAWWLEVDGLVERPLRLALADLDALPRREIVSVHECAGSPLTPREPKRRVGNVRWLGIPLLAVLDRAGVREDARFVWSEGLEWGEFAGLHDEPFVKDMPLAKAPDALLATHLNGAPLSPDRGGPVRLVVPGWYGTNSVKWLGRLTLADRRAPGPFTTRFYNDPGPNGPVPVWGIAPESILVLPAPDGPPPRAGQAVEVRGWAWADGGVDRAEVSADGGATWHRAGLEARTGFAWQRFTWSWIPAGPGRHRLQCRCFDAHGRGQPATDARNAVHAVELEVVV